MYLFGNICVCFEENWTNVNGSIYGGPAEVLERPVSQGTSSGNIFLLVLTTPLCWSWTRMRMILLSNVHLVILIVIQYVTTTTNLWQSQMNKFVTVKQNICPPGPTLLVLNEGEYNAMFFLLILFIYLIVLLSVKKLVVSQKTFGGQKAWSRKRQGRLLALSEN